MIIIGLSMIVIGIVFFLMMGENLVLPLIGSVFVFIGIVLLVIAGIRFLRKSK